MKRGKPAKDNKSAYSMTEVGALLESMDKKIDMIADGHAGLDAKMDSLEVAVHGNSRRLDTVELSNSVLNGKVSRLEDAVSKLSKDLKGTRTELKTEIEEVKNELKAEIAGVKTELKADIRDLGNRLAGVESRL